MERKYYLITVSTTKEYRYGCKELVEFTRHRYVGKLSRKSYDYLIVREYTENGMLHTHMLLEQTGSLRSPALKRIPKGYNIDVREIERVDCKNVINYICKDIRQDAEKFVHYNATDKYIGEVERAINTVRHKTLFII